MKLIKLSEPQKMLLTEMRKRQMKLVNNGYLTWYDWVNNKGNIPFVTANALKEKCLFTVDKNGYCNLTHLGKTIEI